MLSEQDIFSIIEDYILSKGLIQHQIDSYNYFINEYLQRIFDEIPDITLPTAKKNEKYIVSFGQAYVDFPKIEDENRQIKMLTPYECRLRDLSYDATISVDIRESWIDTEKDKIITENLHPKTFISRVPVMINSCRCNLERFSLEEKIKAGECEADPGGYFIIRGKERTLICQERINYNHVYVFEQKVNSKTPYVAEIRSMSDETGHSVLIQAKLSNDGRNVLFNIPYIKDDIPARIIFKALNFSDSEIESLIGLHTEDQKINDILNTILTTNKKIKNRDDALHFIGQNPHHIISDDKKYSYAEQVIDNELFPHLGNSSEKERGLMIGNMIKNLILTFVGLRQPDDRDNLSLKRVEGPGTLIGDLFRMLVKRMIESAKKYLIKRQDILIVLSRVSSVNNGLKHSFSTGNWGVQKNNYIRSGVSQVLNRLSYSASISHLRRVVIPIGKEGKNTKIRQLHPTQMFFIDPAETPEGQSVGIVKNLAMMAKLSTGIPTVQVREVVETSKNLYLISEISIDEIDITMSRIFINGVLIGFTDNIKSFIEDCKMFRKLGLLHHEISISYDDIDNDIKILSDDGRLIRPVFVVENGELLIKKEHTNFGWDRLVEEGYIQYVDNNEVENNLIAMQPKDLDEYPENKFHYSYCEIHPSLMLGVCTGAIPYCLSMDTEVLTKNGWKQHKDLTYDDEIATLDNNKLVYSKPSEIMKFKYQGKMYHIRRECLDLLTTPNHRMYVAPRSIKTGQEYGDYTLLKAEDIFGKRVRYQSNAEWDKEDYYFTLPAVKNHKGNKDICFDTEEKMNAWLDFFGIWIAEGYASIKVRSEKEGHKMGIDYRIVISQMKESSQKFIKNCLDILGFKYTISLNKDFILWNKQLTCYLEPLSNGSSNAFLPEWVWELSKKQCNKLIDALILGDGTQTNTKSRQYYTSSKILADQVQRLLLHAGICGSIDINKEAGSISHMFKGTDKEQTITSQYDCYRVGLRTDNRCYPGTAKKKSRSNNIKIGKREPIEDWVDYDDYVWCVTVPSHIFYVRRNGIPVWTGNCNHNQSPRNCYQTSMMKQALGLFATNYKDRVDTVVHVLHQPQKPLISTKFNKMLKYDDMPSGINAIVAVACYTGLNQEDSVIINKGAIDRGLFVSSCYKTLICDEKKKSANNYESVEIPPIQIRQKNYNYSKLGPDGIVKKGTLVLKGDVIVGKVNIKSYKDDDEEKVDCSYVIKNGEEGVVDMVYTGLSSEGYRLIKIKIRSLRIPEVGDKVASRSAQKGTIGMILNHEDLPFTSDGIVPDIIINSHCLTGDTKISMFNGVSKRIDQLSKEGGEMLLSWNRDNKGIELETQLGLMEKGEREIIQLTLIDGRKIKCTPEHKFLTKNEKDEFAWVEAQHLQTIGEVKDGKWIEKEGKCNKLVIGPDFPLDYPDEKERIIESNWSLNSEKLSLDMKTALNREKSLAFARLLGFVLSDGCVSVGDRNKCNMCFGHKLDVETALKDIFLITGKTPKYSFNKTYNLALPSEISNSIVSLDGIMTGKRVYQQQSLPTFLLDKNCPKSIIREFLGGLFGGDGHSPCLRRNTAENRKDKSGNDRFNITKIRYSKCVVEEYIDSMKIYMENLKTLLNKLGIVDTSIYSLDKSKMFHNNCIDEDKKENTYYEYRISIDNSTKFADFVGFRYCIQKSCRLFVANSYFRYVENIIRQHNLMIEKTNEYFDNGVCNSLIKSREMSNKTLLDTEPPINTYYSLGTKYMISNRRKKARKNDLNKLDYKYVKDPETFFKDSGCLDWFWEEGVSGKQRRYIINHEDKFIPFFTMDVLEKRDAGVEKVWDISVAKNQSFISEGVITHNCLPSRMTLAQLIECLQGKRCAMLGEYADATPFSEETYDPVEKIADELQKTGYERYGNEEMFNGFTGELLKAKIFIGPTYYQRLKHLVADKIHSRSLGNVTMLSRQPAEGRSRDGGLRLGLIKHLAQVSTKIIILIIISTC